MGLFFFEEKILYPQQIMMNRVYIKLQQSGKFTDELNDCEKIHGQKNDQTV